MRECITRWLSTLQCLSSPGTVRFYDNKSMYLFRCSLCHYAHDLFEQWPGLERESSNTDVGFRIPVVSFSMDQTLLSKILRSV